MSYTVYSSASLTSSQTRLSTQTLQQLRDIGPISIGGPSHLHQAFSETSQTTLQKCLKNSNIYVSNGYPNVKDHEEEEGGAVFQLGDYGQVQGLLTICMLHEWILMETEIAPTPNRNLNAAENVSKES